VENLVAIFVTGNVLIAGLGKAASFYILVPISYLLILSAGLLLVCRFYKYTFYVLCTLCLLCNFALESEGLRSNNLELVTIGLLGLILGYTPIEKINSFVRHPYLLSLAYLCYTAAITVWEPNYLLQIAGVCLTLALIYLVGTASSVTGAVQRKIILLGRYPLFGYIAQVAILQLLRTSLGHVNLGTGLLIASFFAALSLTVTAVVIIESLRARSRAIDWLYKQIFA
jgi:hypothetical protein